MGRDENEGGRDTQEVNIRNLIIMKKNLEIYSKGNMAPLSFKIWAYHA